MHKAQCRARLLFTFLEHSRETAATELKIITEMLQSTLHKIGKMI